MAKLLTTTVTGTLTVNNKDVLSGIANSANTVRVSANGASTQVAANGLNFINTASVQVLVETGTDANANVSFTVIGGAQGATGLQGIQGIQGVQGEAIQGAAGTVQGTTGLQGIQGIQGVQGTQGTQGTQGIQGLQGVQGIAGPRTLNYVISGGGATITTGATEAAQSKGYVFLSQATTISGWSIFANTAGACRVDVYTGTYTAFPTMVLISGTNAPNTGGAQKNTGTTTGWGTTAIAAGNIIQFRVNSSPTVAVEQVTVALNIG